MHYHLAHLVLENARLGEARLHQQMTQRSAPGDVSAVFALVELHLQVQHEEVQILKVDLYWNLKIQEIFGLNFSKTRLSITYDGASVGLHFGLARRVPEKLEHPGGVYFLLVKVHFPSIHSNRSNREQID